MRWPLRYQILFPFGGVMLAVVLGVSLLDAVLAARRTQRQIEHQLQRGRPDAAGRQFSADRRRAQANPRSVGGRVPADRPARQFARAELGADRR